MEITEKKMDEMISSPEVQAAMKKAKSISDLSGPGGPLQMLMKKMIDQFMEAERTVHLGYENNDRQNKSNPDSRNGYSKKSVKTSIGPMDLDVPRVRKGEFYPTLLEKYKSLDPDIERKILSMYSKGMSTRDVTDLIGDIYGTDVSAGLVSQVTNQIKDDIISWQMRPLESVYSVVFFDAIFFKTRQDNKVSSKAAYTCFGINMNGDVDILGIWLAETEGSRFWLSVLNEIKNRGVQDIFIACVDGLKGFPEAIETIFPKTDVQLCIVHQIRNSVRYVSSKDVKEFVIDMKQIYQAENEALARTALIQLKEKWGNKYPSAVNSWETNWDRLTAYFKYPNEIRKMIYTTNIVENVHRQFRKVMKTKSSFPNDDSLKKMIYLAIQGVLSKSPRKNNWAVIAGQLAIHFRERIL